eukprot:254455-Pyramimonas_sp.AAC.1
MSSCAAVDQAVNGVRSAAQREWMVQASCPSQLLYSALGPSRDPRFRGLGWPTQTRPTSGAQAALAGRRRRRALGSLIGKQ